MSSGGESERAGKAGMLSEDAYPTVVDEVNEVFVEAWRADIAVLDHGADSPPSPITATLRHTCGKDIAALDLLERRTDRAPVDGLHVWLRVVAPALSPVPAAPCPAGIAEKILLRRSRCTTRRRTCALASAEVGHTAHSCL